MSRRLAMTDLGIAFVLAILVLIISPGVAIAGLIAAIVLVACGVSFALDARRRSRRARMTQRPRRSRTTERPGRRR